MTACVGLGDGTTLAAAVASAHPTRKGWDSGAIYILNTKTSTITHVLQHESILRNIQTIRVLSDGTTIEATPKKYDLIWRRSEASSEELNEQWRSTFWNTIEGTLVDAPARELPFVPIIRNLVLPDGTAVNVGTAKLIKDGQTFTGSMSVLGNGRNFYYEDAGLVYAAGLFGDGKCVLTVQQDTSIHLWDATTGAQLYFLDGPETQGDWAGVKQGALWGLSGRLVPVGRNVLAGLAGGSLVVLRADCLDEVQEIRGKGTPRSPRRDPSTARRGGENKGGKKGARGDAVSSRSSSSSDGDEGRSPRAASVKHVFKAKGGKRRGASSSEAEEEAQP